MAHQITGTLYKLTYTATWHEFVECNSETDLYRYVAKKAINGHLVTSVVEICPDGSTPRVKLHSSKEYKQILHLLQNPREVVMKEHYSLMPNDCEYALAPTSKDAECMKKQLQILLKSLSRGKVSNEDMGGSLDAILREHFGCKRPFYKRPVVKEDLGYGMHSYEYITVSGSRAYEKLVALIYDLGNLLPELVDASEIIECLDDIVGSPGY